MTGGPSVCRSRPQEIWLASEHAGGVGSHVGVCRQLQRDVVLLGPVLLLLLLLRLLLCWRGGVWELGLWMSGSRGTTWTCCGRVQCAGYSCVPYFAHLTSHLCSGSLAVSLLF